MQLLPFSRFQLPQPFLLPDGESGGSGGGSSDSNANAGGNQGGSEGKQGDGKQGDTAKAEAVTVTIEGKNYVLQGHVDKLVGDARKEGKTAGVNETKSQAEEAVAREKGEWETVAKKRETRIQELEAEIAQRDAAALRARIAAKHKLPEELASRLQGENEADLEADAKALAKLVRPPAAPDTEAGAQQQNGGAGLSNRQKESTGAKPGEQPTYRFIPKNAITIPS